MNDILLALALTGMPFFSASVADASAPADDERIEQIAREFRIATYRTFRHDRVRCENRWTVGRDVYAAWLAAQQRERHRKAVSGWFHAAIAASRKGSIGPLPKAPTFETVAGVTPGGRRETLGDTPVEAPVDVATLVGQPPSASELSRLDVAWRARRSLSDAPLVLAVRPTDLADAAQPAGKFRPSTFTLPGDRLEHAALAAALMGRADARPDDRTATDDIPEAWPAELPPETTPREERPKPDGPDLPALDINVSDLAARVKGTNFRLRSIENDLKDDARWTARRLEPLVNDLNDLVQRRAIARPYMRLLTASQRRTVGRLEPIEPVVSALGKRIFQARARATSDEFGGTRTQRRAELVLLDDLSRKLGTLIEKDR